MFLYEDYETGKQRSPPIARVTNKSHGLALVLDLNGAREVNA